MHTLFPHRVKLKVHGGTCSAAFDVYWHIRPLFLLLTFGCVRCHRQLRQERLYVELLSEMSPDLRGKVMHHTFSKWLSVVPFFDAVGGPFSPLPVASEKDAFLYALSTKIVGAVYAPLEGIICAGVTVDSLSVFHML
jgi:hypothetical protein